MFGLFRTKYDLKWESELAGFRGNVKHFKGYLIHCPKSAVGKYGWTKYEEMKKQIALLEKTEPTNVAQHKMP
jgi:hypothetical protein